MQEVYFYSWKHKLFLVIHCLIHALGFFRFVDIFKQKLQFNYGERVKSIIYSVDENQYGNAQHVSMTPGAGVVTNTKERKIKRKFLETKQKEKKERES